MKQSADHHSILRACLNVLRSFGLWKISPESSKIKLYLYLFYKCFVLMMICLFIAALAADLRQSTDDLLIMTDDGCILAGLSLILFKLLNFQIYSDELQHLLDFVDENVKILHAVGNPEFVKIWKFHVLKEAVTISCFGTIGISLVFGLMFLTSTEPGVLPIRSKYPFDVTKAPLHQVMFFYQGCVLTVAMMSLLAIDHTMATICSQIFCHFEILKKNFCQCLVQATRDTGVIGVNSNVENLIRFDDEELRINNENENSFDIKSGHGFIKNLKKCVKRHQEMIKLVQDLDKFFSPLMFVQLMSSNIMICLTSFQAVLVVGQGSDFMKFAVYLSAAFFQLFYWCWCGNELIYQSMSIAEEVWMCPWELEKMTSIKTLIMIPVMRAKQPLQLSAGKFFVMSMDTFISVLSGSYSFFTLLNKMNE